MCSHWIALQNVLLLEYMKKCALIDLPYLMCSYWDAWGNVLPLEYIEKMCSHWIVLHNVLILGYMWKCAPIGLHCTMCSYWNTWRNVLSLDYITPRAHLGVHEENVPPTAKCQNLTSFLQRNILLLSHVTRSAFNFTFWQKCSYWLALQRTCAPIDSNSKLLFFAVNNNNSTFH